jgi:hypothetical protein
MVSVSLMTRSADVRPSAGTSVVVVVVGGRVVVVGAGVVVVEGAEAVVVTTVEAVACVDELSADVGAQAKRRQVMTAGRTFIVGDGTTDRAYSLVG